MTPPFTAARKAHIIENWTYKLCDAKSDLRQLPPNHHERSYVEAQVQECKERIAYFQSLPTTDEPDDDPQPLKQIFITFLKLRNLVQVRSELLPHVLTLPTEVFHAWKQRGVIVTHENHSADVAKVESPSWESFTAGCLEWEKTILRRAEIQAQIAAIETTVQEGRRSHRPVHDLEESLCVLRAELTA